MKNYFYLMTIMALVLLYSCHKDEPRVDLVDFEELSLNNDGYWNGSADEGEFSSGNILFPNLYNSQYESWSGFAYSNHTNNVTGDYSNQYSSIVGWGAGLSENYAVLFSWASDTIVFDIPEKITNISISNSTYAYKTMAEGNMFAKKFGGEDGTDQDWFTLKISGIDHSGSVKAIVTIYLADFRSSNSDEDYISNVWNDFDLSEMGFVKKLVFEIGSSDVGDYGINTPTYVCIDNIEGKLIEIE